MNSFQKSRLGLLPSEWSVRQVNQLMDEHSIIGHLDGNHGSDYPRSEEFVDTGIPYISANCLKDGQVNFGLAKYLHPDRARALRKGKARPGDVLFAHNATVGPVALLDSSSPLVILSTTLTYFRTDERRLHNKYLKAFLESDHFRGQYEPLMAQSTRDQVPITVQRSFWIAVPPLPEQLKIAEILSTWDDAIATVDALIAALQRRKQGLMQRLLTGQVRFAEFEGSEWQELSLGQFLKYSPRKVEKPESAYRRMGIRSHGKGTFVEIVENPESNSMDYLYEVKADDLIVSITFAWEQAIAIVAEEDAGALVSHRFPTYEFNRKKAVSEFFRYLMLTKRFLDQLGLITPGGAGRNRVMSKTDFLKLRVSLPSVPEQKRIGEVLMAVDKEIKTHEMYLKSLRQQKKGLMQRLLSGQVRVEV